jgi:hypothetical protein
MPPDLLVLALLALTLLVVSATSLVGSVVFDPDAASGVAVSDVPVASGAAAGFDSCFFSSAGGSETPGVSSSLARMFQLSFIEDLFLLISDL